MFDPRAIQRRYWWTIGTVASGMADGPKEGGLDAMAICDRRGLGYDSVRVYGPQGGNWVVKLRERAGGGKHWYDLTSEHLLAPVD